MEAPPTSGREPSGGKPLRLHHTAALETVLLTCPAPSLEGAPSGQTEPSEAHTWVCDKKGTCWVFFLTLYFGCTHVFNLGAQG